MDHTTFHFGDLPIELAFLVFKYAAQPTFDQAEKHDRNNPYSSAFELCLVSKSVRRAVLPVLLQTILLPESRNVRLFVQALFMQEEYKKAGSDLQYQYAPRVRKMWIGSDGGNLTPTNLEHALQPSERPLAISLLTLALSWTSVSLLIECLQDAWKFRLATPVDEEQTHRHSPGSCLPSICHLSSLSYIICRDCESLPLAKEYWLPGWMHAAPLASFKSLHTVILPYQRVKPPTSLSALINRGVDMQMETGIPKAIKGFVDVLPGQKGTRSDDTCLWVSSFKVRWYSRLGWETVWACDL
ncbi:hypothetical protein CY34DRAFT_813356 [Suillus luteus UH-Slu-Lm8-n1]|uniref:Uncharacterized protein n=1 Tax=Suillus luteus UH-Slu-Lm8-n1 TaxID=930992 RepID=A0A0C9ZWM1_9AGAM|nr:hypothetical protein CY34DRAFT_813356 [Suillus luteus UH-Slu-Lm8-n1]